MENIMAFIVAMVARVFLKEVSENMWSIHVYVSIFRKKNEWLLNIFGF